MIWVKGSNKKSKVNHRWINLSMKLQNFQRVITKSKLMIYNLARKRF